MWVQEHKSIIRNEAADNVAKQEVNALIFGPESFCDLPKVA